MYCTVGFSINRIIKISTNKPGICLVVPEIASIISPKIFPNFNFFTARIDRLTVVLETIDTGIDLDFLMLGYFVCKVAGRETFATKAVFTLSTGIPRRMMIVYFLTVFPLTYKNPVKKQ